MKSSRVWQTYLSISKIKLKDPSLKIPKQILINVLDGAKTTGDLCGGLNMLKSTDCQGRSFSFLKYTAFTVDQNVLEVTIFLRKEFRPNFRISLKYNLPDFVPFVFFFFLFQNWYFKSKIEIIFFLHHLNIC